MDAKQQKIGFLELALAFTIWSSWIVPVRLIGQNPFTIAFFVSLFVSIIWGAVLLLKFRQGFIVEKKVSLLLLLQALFFQLNMLTYLAALQYTDAAVAVLTHYTAPIFVAILAPFILKERLTVRVIISLVLAAAGFVIIFFKRPAGGEHFWMGAFLGFASGLFYALIIILGKDLLNRIRGEVLLFYQNLFGVFMLLFFAPFISFKQDYGFYPVMMFIAALYPALASYFYMRGLKKVESIKASIVGYVEPLGAVAWGWLFFSEQITIRTVIGGFFILYSGYYVTKQE